jgi:NAD-dependent dihydropyrimidine dehydrogenase PreA subunit
MIIHGGNILKNIIFYFTGTGNSLVVARDIAHNIEDTKIVSIVDAIKESHIELDYERIGFVFPVYFSCMPKIVKLFIKKLHFKKGQYVFGVITLSAICEIALSELSSSVHEQGGILNGEFLVNMPGNNIIVHGSFPVIIQRWLLKKEKKKARYISDVVREKSTTPIKKGDVLSRLTEKTLHKTIEEDFNKRAQNFHVTSKCTGCGICENVCPVENIKIGDLQPKWGNNCEQCMACIQWCPNEAIEYSNKTTKRVRYHNSEVKIYDMISK